MSKYKVNEVFTPSSPAKFAFIERQEDVNDKLVDALNTPGMQIVIYGYSGSGKSTLVINKLKQLFEEEPITTRCMVGMTMDSIMYNGFDQLDKFYVDTKESGSKMLNRASLSVSYLGIKSQIYSEYTEEEKLNSKRILPIQLSPQRLAEFFGEANSCWVIEDFHKIEPKEKVKLAQIMKVFMDSASKYPLTKIIAIGAVGTAKEVIEYDNEMKNRVTELYVPLMENDEIMQILFKGEQLLKINIKNGIKSKIVKYSSGLAAICHQLCLNICFELSLYETSEDLIYIKEEEFEKAVKKFLDYRSDTYKTALDKALKIYKLIKYDNPKIILSAMLHLEAEEVSFTEIYNKIKQNYPEYPAGNLGKFLKLLQKPERGEIIKYNDNSNKFSFTDPFIRSYTYCALHKPTKKIDDSERIKMVLEMLKKFDDSVFKIKIKTND